MSSRLFRTTFLVTMLTTTAASAIELPGSIDSSRIQEQRSTPAPKFDSAEPSVGTPELTIDAPKDAEKMSISLQSITLEGATAYDTETLSTYYQDLIGKKATLRDLYAAAAKITYRYREDGYLLSRAVIPPQEIKGGKARIQVIEGYIHTITQEGDYLPHSVPEGMMKNIAAEKPLNAKTLERYMLLLNDLPGVNARALLRPAEDKSAPPGSVDLAIVFQRISHQASVGADNYSSRYLGPYQANGSYIANSLISPYSQTQAGGYITIPMDELQYVYIEQQFPIDSEGTTLDVNVAYSNTEPGYNISASDVKGDTYTATFSATHPIMRTRQDSVWLTGEFVYRNSETDILGTQLSHDKLRILRLSGLYSGTDQFRGSNVASVAVSQGLDMLGASDAGDMNLSRAQGDGGFTKLTFELARLQSLSPKWALQLSTSGQYAADPLLSSEEFGIGGQRYGRAYDPSEITGDQGIAGSIELRYLGIPRWEQLDTELFSFYDIGKVWNEDIDGIDESLSSVGLGARMNYGDAVSGTVNVAVPLSRRVEAPSYGDGYDPRLFFSLNYRF